MEVQYKIRSIFFSDQLNIGFHISTEHKCASPTRTLPFICSTVWNDDAKYYFAKLCLQLAMVLGLIHVETKAFWKFKKSPNICNIRLNSSDLLPKILPTTGNSPNNYNNKLQPKVENFKSYLQVTELYLLLNLNFRM